MPDTSTMQSPDLAGTDADDTVYVHNVTGGPIEVEAVDLMPDTAVSTHASNYITTTVSTAGGTLGTHTTNSSGGSAMVAGTVNSLSLTADRAKLRVAAGGKITIAVAKSGTGPAYKFAGVVRYRRVRV